MVKWKLLKNDFASGSEPAVYPRKPVRFFVTPNNCADFSISIKFLEQRGPGPSLRSGLGSAPHHCGHLNFLSLSFPVIEKMAWFHPH